MRGSNGDTDRVVIVDGDAVVGLGSYHKTLGHNRYGEVLRDDFERLKLATRGGGEGFAGVPKGGGAGPTYTLTNPQAGLAADPLTHHPAGYAMPPAPRFDRFTTAAEMIELYWMAALRDVPLSTLASDGSTAGAVDEINDRFAEAIADPEDPGRLRPGTDVPGSATAFTPFTKDTIFRLGLPGEDKGPLISQFFLRDIAYGAQSIDQRIDPYAAGKNYLTDFTSWLKAQSSGNDAADNGYNRANEDSLDRYETMADPADPAKQILGPRRHISTMRDIARFVNKDALHQAYFNAALILLSGNAGWTDGNPYGDCGPLRHREAGFGTLGGPHILALVSEVATRALKIVWNQKWQVHLRLRPEAYGGLVYVQNEGVGGDTRAYGLPAWVATSKGADAVAALDGGGPYLLPMAFTPGSPSHPSYGAGHATVAGACVTVLKAWFRTFDGDAGKALAFQTLSERSAPYGEGGTIAVYETGTPDTGWALRKLRDNNPVAKSLTIEGELNKLAMNVAMGRSMGGVHWRTDNTRSLVLGEAIAAEILADITTDCNEKPAFEFRSFARAADGEPHKVRIANGRIHVDGVLVDTHGSGVTG